MASFVGRLQNILASKWLAIVLISLLLSCPRIFPITNASAQTCSWDWDITSTSGIKTNYQPGETISGDISFRLHNAANSGAIQQLLIGIIDSQNKVFDVKCIYNGIPKDCPEWTTGTATFSLKAPVTPGNYKVIASVDLHNSCSDAINRFPSLCSSTSPYCKDITTITISASPPACGGNWDITETRGIKTNYQPGETISGSISFKINNQSGESGGRQQILVGLVDSQNRVIDVECIYDGRPKVCPEWTIDTVNVSWESPATPGTYRILAKQDAHYSCSYAKLNFSPNELYKNIATITVSASQTGEDTKTSSPGSGMPQDEGAPTIGNNTLLIIAAIVLLILILILSFLNSKNRKVFLKFILGSAIVSFLGYLLWMYGIPAITGWFSKNLSTIIGILLLLVILAIAGIAIRKNWNKLPRLPSGPRGSPQSLPELGGATTSTIKKGMRFEQKCETVLENMGFDCKTTKPSGDGGIDLICHSNKPLISGIYVVQCKDWKNRPVGEPVIRDLFGTVTSERANKGILITSSYFTKAAWSFAEGKNIELIDGDKLNKLAKKD